MITKRENRIKEIETKVVDNDKTIDKGALYLELQTLYNARAATRDINLKKLQNEKRSSEEDALYWRLDASKSIEKGRTADIIAGQRPNETAYYLERLTRIFDAAKNAKISKPEDIIKAKEDLLKLLVSRDFTDADIALRHMVGTKFDQLRKYTGQAKPQTMPPQPTQPVPTSQPAPQVPPQPPQTQPSIPTPQTPSPRPSSPKLPPKPIVTEDIRKNTQRAILEDMEKVLKPGQLLTPEQIMQREKLEADLAAKPENSRETVEREAMKALLTIVEKIEEEISVMENSNRYLPDRLAQMDIQFLPQGIKTYEEELQSIILNSQTIDDQIAKMSKNLFSGLSKDKLTKRQGALIKDLKEKLVDLKNIATEKSRSDDYLFEDDEGDSSPPGKTNPPLEAGAKEEEDEETEEPLTRFEETIIKITDKISEPIGWVIKRINKITGNK